MRAAASGFSGGMWRGHGVLALAVPALEPWVRGRTAHYDPGFLAVDPGFPHAHVTVLAPFPDDVHVAAAVAATATPFSFALERVGVFADGTIHLVPEPAESLAALTRTAREMLPDVVPYWGRFEPVPHMTLDRLGPGVTLESTAGAVAGALPARVLVEELVLTWWETGACRVLGRFPLG